ncbi:MAG TPA: HIT domain-containing protein [Phycisphaerae bacterium]|nr:HIT domain-containing protein [Phycisphaerae bacterium]
MDEEQTSPEWKTNLWAPWRMEYIESLGGEQEGCFLCDLRDNPDGDEENLLLWRGRRSLTVLNRFPYTGGHSLIAPLAHVAGLADLDDATILEMMGAVRDVQRALSHALRAQGFNIGINVGRCAGAGLPGHLHIHVVPRWSGDTNFIAVFGDVRVIPESLRKLRERIRRAGEELGLPADRPQPAG